MFGLDNTKSHSNIRDHSWRIIRPYVREWTVGVGGGGALTRFKPGVLDDGQSLDVYNQIQKWTDSSTDKQTERQTPEKKTNKQTRQLNKHTFKYTKRQEDKQTAEKTCS